MHACPMLFLALLHSFVRSCPRTDRRAGSPVKVIAADCAAGRVDGTRLNQHAIPAPVTEWPSSKYRIVALPLAVRGHDAP